MKLDKTKLLAVIDRMRKAVEEDDSFEGSLSYSAMHEGLERGEFEVGAFFRIGNSEGQGGSIIVQSDQPDEGVSP